MLKYHTNKSIFVYAFITLFIFVVIFGVFTQIISRYFSKKLENELIIEARYIGNAYYDLSLLDKGDKSFINYKLKLLTDHYNAHTFIIGPNDEILIDSLMSESYCMDYEETKPLINKAFSGSVNIRKGYQHNDMEKLVLSIAVPIIRNNKTQFVVVMHSPMPETNSTIFFIYKITFITLLLALSLAFIYTITFSAHTNRTLEALNRTSKEVASGNFESRVDLSFAGEFGELAKNMNNMAEELGKLETMRKDFIANISHDFRSPLTSIKGFVQAILDGTIAPESQDRYLNIVLEETERLTSLTNNLLLLSRMENNQDFLERSPFDIHQIIRKVLLQFDQQIINKSLDVKLLFYKKDLFVYADMHQIQRVLYNLIDNAIKFSYFQGELIVETLVVKDKVEVSISDTGQGISQENLTYIWDRFHKADRSRGKDKKGIGLGLSIVKEIIKAHGESIDVFSQLERGTKFVFTLPIATSKKPMKTDL